MLTLLDSIFMFFYDFLAPPEFWVKHFKPNKIKLLKNTLSSFGTDIKTLEIGCGEGYITRSLVLDKSVKYGVGIDLLKNRITKANNRAKLQGIQDKTTFKTTDARKPIPFGDNSIDVVMILDVLEHLGEKEKVINTIKEAKRIASKGIIISIPQNDCKNFFNKYAKYTEFDHLRVYLRYKNGWIYDPEQFQSMLKDIGLKFEREKGSVIYKIIL